MTDDTPNFYPGARTDDSVLDEPDIFNSPPRISAADVSEPPHPVNWNLLTAHELEQEWLALNRWVDWLRHTYGLPASVIPPFWHHHPELVWELSALHLHWLCAYDAEQNANTAAGNRCLALCRLNGATPLCPRGAVCEPTDLPDFGVCL